MDTEVLETPETPTADEAAEEAALVSAFESSTETPTPESTTTAPTEEAAAKEDKPAETPATPAEAVAQAIEYAQLTKQEKDDLVKALVKSNKLDQVLGTVGNIQNELKQMRSGGKPLSLTGQHFKKLNENQFEELAKILADDFNGIFKELKTGGGVDVDEVVKTIRGPLLQEAQHAARHEACREYLFDEHEDWEQVVGMPDEKGTLPDTEFRRWVATTKTDAQQTKIWNSKNGPYLAKVIQEFKDHKAKGKQPAKPVADPKADARKAQLEAAVDPKGEPATGATTKSEEDEFVEETNRTLKARGGLV